MGIIKLPQKSIDFFEKNYKEIFKKGTLAEGEWNKETSSIVKNYVNCDFAIPTSSGGYALSTTSFARLCAILYS